MFIEHSVFMFVLLLLLLFTVQLILPLSNNYILNSHLDLLCPLMLVEYPWKTKSKATRKLLADWISNRITVISMFDRNTIISFRGRSLIDNRMLKATNITSSFLVFLGYKNIFCLRCNLPINSVEIWKERELQTTHRTACEQNLNGYFCDDFVQLRSIFNILDIVCFLICMYSRKNIIT